MADKPLLPLFRRQAIIDNVTHAGLDVVILRIVPDPWHDIVFRAGQYAMLSFSDLAAQPYSFASSPSVFAKERCLEFHIPRQSWNFLKEKIQPRSIHIEGPYGDAHWRENHDGPVIAIAGGSGLAPVKSIIEESLQQSGHQSGQQSGHRPLHLYHGVREAGSVYLEDYFHNLARQHDHFAYQSILPSDHDIASGSTALWHAVRSDWTSLSGCKVYMAGPQAMVDMLASQLRQYGVDGDDLHCDGIR